jgi:hypothetical protein
VKDCRDNVVTMTHTSKYSLHVANRFFDKGLLIVLAAVVLLSIAFFSFLGITKAFLDDKWGMCALTSPGNYDNYNCNSLIGNQQFTVILIKYTADWKPGMVVVVVIGVVVLLVLLLLLLLLVSGHAAT